jgi:mono/diheme cytochrome c family protein
MSAPSQPSLPPGKASTHQLEQGAASDASITSIHQTLLREKPEPVEGFSPIPIFLLFVFSALIFFGGVYIAHYAGDFDPMAFDPSRGRQVAVAGPAAPVDPMVLGKRLFEQNCIACHQLTGLGVPGSFPPLVDSEWVLGNEERLVRILLHGLSGPVVVKGNTYNGAMPAFGPKSGYRFNEQKIAAVLTYIRASWGNSAPAVTPEKVKEVMAAVGDRPGPWTAAELEAFK